MTLSLDQAVDYAIKNSFSNRIAKEDIKSAKKQKWETTTIGLPSIDAGIDYQNFLKQQVLLIFGRTPEEFTEILFGPKQNLNLATMLSWSSSGFHS